MSQELIKLIGGVIWATSVVFILQLISGGYFYISLLFIVVEVGVGSIFNIAFPVSLGVSELSALKSRSEELKKYVMHCSHSHLLEQTKIFRSPLQASPRNKRAIIVERLATSSILKFVLEASGYECEIFHSLQAALDAFVEPMGIFIVDFEKKNSLFLIYSSIFQEICQVKVIIRLFYYFFKICFSVHFLFIRI